MLCYIRIIYSGMSRNGDVNTRQRDAHVLRHCPNSVPAVTSKGSHVAGGGFWSVKNHEERSTACRRPASVPQGFNGGTHGYSRRLVHGLPPRRAASLLSLTFPAIRRGYWPPVRCEPSSARGISPRSCRSGRPSPTPCRPP